MKDRYEQRPKGRLIRLLDQEKVKAFLEAKFPDLPVRVGQYAIAVGKDGAAIVGTEGVGYFADNDGNYPIHFLLDWGHTYIDVSGADLASLLSRETIDIADLVRVFGDRLENNFFLWYHYTSGHNQTILDDMVEDWCASCQYLKPVVVDDFRRDDTEQTENLCVECADRILGYASPPKL